jgi:transcriptional regulator with GAF, ATPase, and Fis domain
MAHMPTRHRYSAAEILEALAASNHDVHATATALGMTERTLQRRMAELGIKARIRYELAEAA